MSDKLIEAELVSPTPAELELVTTKSLLQEVPSLVHHLIKAANVEERIDRDLISESIYIELQRFFRKRSGQRHLVLPVIKEI